MMILDSPPPPCAARVLVSDSGGLCQHGGGDQLCARILHLDILREHVCSGSDFGFLHRGARPGRAQGYYYIEIPSVSECPYAGD